MKFMMKPPVIKTPRLLLQPILEKDKNEMMEIVVKDEVKKTYMIPDFANLEEKEKFVNRLKELSGKLDRFVYAIYLNQHIIGFMNEVNKTEDSIEIGYFIDPKYWNQGYATEALKEAIKYLFRMGYLHVTASHFAINPASGRVMEKAGMRKTSERSFIDYRGQTHELVNYIIDK